jgi:hypothetical protein
MEFGANDHSVERAGTLQDGSEQSLEAAADSFMNNAG